MANKKNNTKKTKTKVSSNKKQPKKTSTKPKKTQTKIKKNNNLLVKTLENNSNYKKAENLYKEKKYEEAYQIYLDLSKEFLKDKKIYKRLIECYTKDYSYKEKNTEFNKTLNEYITTYKLLCNAKEIKYLDNRLDEYKHVKCKGKKSKFLLIFFFGWFGIHKFIEKKYLLGIIYLFTFGLLGFGVIYDLIQDYNEYEDNFQSDLVRYFISFCILSLSYIFKNNDNFYCFVLGSIIFLPFIYSKILKFIPHIIKLIVIAVLIYFGFKNDPIIGEIPNSFIGTWNSMSENTNIKQIEINSNTGTVKFTDREDETGKIEYDSKKGILTIAVNEIKYYKFILNDNTKLCSYNEAETCIISFAK